MISMARVLDRKQQLGQQVPEPPLRANDGKSRWRMNSDGSTQIPPLTIRAGDHLELGEDDDDQGSSILPYEHVRLLGHGGNASVEMVRDINTGSVYARKIIRNVYSRNMKDARQKLLNEVRIMQRLASHHHIVKVHATYIKKRELAIIINPAADAGDLASFLQNYRDQGFSWFNGSSNDRNLLQNDILRKAFYCLASALAFIHEQTIRHKDIKPQNILIHEGKVLYTDFGLSYDFKDAGRSTTTGNPQGVTRRYCAPEVAEWGSRNSKSDIFSLGCVFIEIYLALAADASHDRIYERPFHEIVRSHPHGLPLPHISNDPPSPDEEPSSRIPLLFDNTVWEMMQEDPESRPPADAVASIIFGSAPYRYFCLECHGLSNVDEYYEPYDVHDT